MRLYTFTHFMLSPIQQGIQSGHASQALINKYIEDRKNSKQLKAIKEWLPQPTVIALNGGNTGGLNAVWAELENMAGFLKLPYADFHEDSESMACIRTSIAVLVPQRIYDAAAAIRTNNPDGVEPDLHPVEIELATFLNKYQLAR